MGVRTFAPASPRVASRPRRVAPRVIPSLGLLRTPAPPARAGIPLLCGHRVFATATGTERGDTLNGTDTAVKNGLLQSSSDDALLFTSTEDGADVIPGGVPRIVGVGAKGCTALDALMRSSILNGASCYAMAADAAIVGKASGAEPLIVAPDAAADIEAATRSSVLKAVGAPAAVFVLAGAGDGGAGRASVSVAAASRDSGMFTTAAMMLPFSFEGAKKVAEAAEVVEEMGRASSLLLVIDQNVLLAQPGMTVDQASTIASSALLRGVRAVCAAACSSSTLVRGGRWEVGPSAAHMRRVLQNGARTSVGHGGAEVSGGREKQAAAKAAEAASQSTFLSGLYEGDGVVACVTGSSERALQGNCEAVERALQKVAHADAEVMVVGVPPPTGAAGRDQAAKQTVEVTLLALLPQGIVAPPPSAPPLADSEGEGEGEGGESARWKMAAALAGGAPSVERSADTDLATVDFVDDFDPDFDSEGGAWDEDDGGEQDESGGPRGGAGWEGGGDGILPGRRPFWRRGPAPKTARERTSGVLASDRSARMGDETSRPIVEMTYPDGSSYKGQWGAGKPEGKGRRVEANGAWYEGHFQDGKKHGWGVSLTWGDRYEGAWAGGLQEGKGALVYQCGDRLEGAFAAGQAEGPGMITYAADGSVFYGTFRRGAMHGRGLLVEAGDGGARWEEVWEDGKRVSVRRVEEEGDEAGTPAGGEGGGAGDAPEPPEPMS